MSDQMMSDALSRTVAESSKRDQVLGVAQFATVAPGESGHVEDETHQADAASPKVSRKGRTRASRGTKTHVSLPASEICLRLMAYQRERRFCVNEVNRSANAAGALARRVMGWSLALPEKEREAIRKEAAKSLKALEDGEIAPGLESVATTLAASIAARQPLIDQRKGIEKHMVALAKQLPVADWSMSVRGFGAGIAMAVIIGEAGDLSQYATVSKLWKRLGWAPKETYHKGESGGYAVPRRVKGELFGAVVVPLMTQNNGKYRECYLARKAAYLERGLVKNHAHKLAMRVMLKTLLADLWGAWREARACGEPRAKLPPADLPRAAE